jgi:hypothetical protein
MVTTSRERQRKWKNNQTSAGKRAVTVMLAPDIKDLIDKERERTGETIAGVIERAVVNLFNPAQADLTNDKPSVTSNNIEDLIIAHPDRQKILRMVRMFNNSKAKTSTIASILSTQNYKTFMVKTSGLRKTFRKSWTLSKITDGYVPTSFLASDNHMISYTI